jgi:AcrR family transcriptional regulator
MTATHSAQPVASRLPEAADAILDAAEAVFAESGFHAATTRAIAALAGVNAALLHYYFGSKEQLYETVVARRASAINDHRRALLAVARRRSDPPQIADVLRAFLRPTIELGRNTGPGGQNYARLVAHVGGSADQRSRRLTAQNYNAIAAEFTEAIMAAVPGLGRADAVRGYLFTMSVGLSLMTRNGRAEDLSGGLCRDDDIDSVIDDATTFAAAGLRAMAGR